LKRYFREEELNRVIENRIDEEEFESSDDGSDSCPSEDNMDSGNEFLWKPPYSLGRRG